MSATRVPAKMGERATWEASRSLVVPVFKVMEVSFLDVSYPNCILKPFLITFQENTVKSRIFALPHLVATVPHVSPCPKATLSASAQMASRDQLAPKTSTNARRTLARMEANVLTPMDRTSKYQSFPFVTYKHSWHRNNDVRNWFTAILTNS